MKMEHGLLDHIVLQRNRRDTSEAVWAGACRGQGEVYATVKKAGNVLRGLASVKVGIAERGRFEGYLKGIPVGGPYEVKLEIKDGCQIVDSLTVKDVMVGDVWIVAGQSNAQGCGFLKNGPKAHPSVRAFYMDDKWRPAKDPIHNMWKTVDQVHIDLCGGVMPTKNLLLGTGPGVSFGQRMHQRTGVPQGILACAHCGTSMAQWDPKLKKLGSKSLYGAMVRRVRKNGGKIAGVIWYQGCSEADPAAAPLYTVRMQKLVASMRRDFHDAALPFVLVQISRKVGVGLSVLWTSIQDQQRRLPRVIRRCATVPAIDLSLDDGIHLSAGGQITLGRRLADAMLVLKQGRRAGKPPIELKRYTIEEDTERGRVNFIVEFDNVVGRLVAGSRPSGFSVVNPNHTEHVYDLRLAGRKAIVRASVPMSMTPSLSLHYGNGTNPYCNVTDEAGRSLPVFGPLPVMSPKAVTGFVQTLRLSRFLPSAGKLQGLAYPRNKAPLKLQSRTFVDEFLSLHAELEKLAPEDVLVFYACDIECSEPMNLAISLGYDGPAKVWVDGKLNFFDPEGINPAIADEKQVKFKAGRGRHEVLIALSSNFGKAWGIWLAFERLSVSKGLLKKGPGHYAMPTILG